MTKYDLIYYVLIFVFDVIGIGELHNLESLDLSNNSLSTLPSCIGNLQNLERMLLSNNKISIVPKGSDVSV